MKKFIFSVALIFSASVLLHAIIVRTEKTPEQIAEIRLLEQQRFDQRERANEEAHRRYLEEQAAKTPEEKAAEITADQIKSAKNTYLGVEAVKFFLK